MAEPMKTQLRSTGATKDGSFHLRFGGYGSWKLKTYGTEGALRTAYVNWLDDLVDIERKFSTEATNAILAERESVKNRALPLECHLRGGLGNPFVARAWHEEPTKRIKPDKSTEHSVTRYEMETTP